MAHPFFDTISFPWNRPEAGRLHRALFQAVPLPADIDLLYHSCGEGLPPLALGFAPDIIWKEVFEKLAVAGKFRRLIELIQGQPKFNAKPFQDAIREVVNAQEAIDKRILSGDILILDRVNLREQLKKLESDESHVRVLLVRGGPGSGKSYGRFLFEGAAKDKGALTIYLSGGIVATVDEVIAALFAALRALDEIPPKNDTTTAAWYRAVLNRLMALAPSQDKPLWIAVDDLGVGQDGAPLLDREIRDFCNQFVVFMGNPAFAKWFRLMLIHYPDGPVPTNWQREFWGEDRTSEADVQQEHVVELVRSWLLAHDRNMIDDDLTALAGSVLATAEALTTAGENKVPRLQGIHDALTETLRTLEGRAV